MLTKDVLGNTVSEQDTVSLAIGSELFIGQVIQITGGLEPSANAQPICYVNVLAMRPIAPNGVILGVAKVETPKAVLEE